MTNEQQDRVKRQTALSNLILAAADLMAPTAQQCSTDNVARCGTAQSVALGVVLISAFPLGQYHVDVKATDESIVVWYAKPDIITSTILLGLGWVAPSLNPEDGDGLVGQWRLYL